MKLVRETYGFPRPSLKDMASSNLLDCCPPALLSADRKNDFLRWLGAHSLPDRTALKLSTHWGKLCDCPLTAADRVRLITQYKGADYANVP